MMQVILRTDPMDNGRRRSLQRLLSVAHVEIDLLTVIRETTLRRLIV